MSDRPTYPELLKLFYKHSFPDQLGAVASSVAQAIIYKANELYFPYEFRMSNVELSHLSGEDVSNIGRSRQKVCEVCKVDEIPLFTYVGNNKRKAGKYIINYSLPSRWRQDNVKITSMKRQDPPLIDNDHNLTLLNTTKTTTDPGDNPDILDYPNTDTDATVVVGLILNKYRSQIMDSTPSPQNMRIALEHYTVEQLTEALKRTPMILKAKKPTTVIDGDYALRVACTAAKHPELWRRDDGGGDGGAGQSMAERDRAKVAKHLALMKEDLARLEAKTEGDWSDAILGMKVAIAEAEVG